METRELSRIDLNLLISLQVLLEERNVSRAAERLFITQPAMSKTLGRLRTLFADDLFTRSSHGMQPTPRALELTEGLSAIIGDISHLISGPHFEPGTADGEITIALSEHAGFALLPRLLAQLSERAPLLNIHIITRIENQLEALARGDLDFAIQIRQSEYSADYKVENLGLSPLSILVREGHPLVNQDISWEQLGNYPLIKLYASPQERMEFEHAGGVPLNAPEHPLATLEISHLLTALELLRQSDYVMPAPAYLLHQEIATAGITGLPLPPESELNIHYALVSHRRTSNSPLHNWLWDLITCTIREMRPKPQRKLRRRMTAGSTNTPS